MAKILIHGKEVDTESFSLPVTLDDIIKEAIADGVTIAHLTGKVSPYSEERGATLDPKAADAEQLAVLRKALDG